jgi:hypothetical protein
LYDNAYNRMIAQKVRQIGQNHVDRINQISDTNTHDITSPLEGMTLRNNNIQGGSGFAAATVADLGFEPTNGATHTASGAGSSGGKRIRSKAKAKSQGGGISGGALLTDASADKVLRPQPEPGMEARITLTASPHKNQPLPQPSQGTSINGALASGSVEASGAGVSAGGFSGGGGVRWFQKGIS